MAKTTILFVRHGQSEANLHDLFAGHSGFSLTPLGREQAKRTAEFIKNTYPVDAVFSSDLPRAFQTAEYTARAFDLPLVTNAHFREIYAGKWEGVDFDQLEKEFPEDLALWLKGTGDSCCTGGETLESLVERVYQGLLGVADKGKCVMIASHATPLRSMLWKASGADTIDMKHITWGSNCGVTEFTLEDGKLTAVKVNQVEHLAGVETKLPDNL